MEIQHGTIRNIEYLPSGDGKINARLTIELSKSISIRKDISFESGSMFEAFFRTGASCRWWKNSFAISPTQLLWCDMIGGDNTDLMEDTTPGPV